MNDAFSTARNIAITLLSAQPIRTLEIIRAKAEIAVNTAAMAGLGDVNVEALISQLMHEANVHVPNATMMEDPTDHIEWLTSQRASIEWKFWDRYRTYLQQEKGLPEAVVTSLGILTDEILGKLESPNRSPPWDCRGMVVGSVQSGKTANYCGLICKAIDSGYRLIVVLAGMHNNLRSQTQYRIDEGVLGRDSQKDRHLDQLNSLIGVGKLFGEHLPVNTLTTSLNDGDFRAPKADTGVTIGTDPVILVIKKNGSVLKNLLRWVLHVRGEDVAGHNGKIVRGVPLLLIDDEADNASINTKDKKGTSPDEVDVTAINGRIRELLDAFEKSAYVGYTATPFANLFINPDAETPKHGDDLFPRSFILNVAPPSNYVSPSRVFGLDGDPDTDIEPKQEMPLCRIVDDNEEAFPPKHKKDLEVDHLPESLEHALNCFVLVCAARRARGQTKVHNSMLVHVTRFINVQNQVATLVHERVESIRRRLTLGEGDRQDKLITRLEKLWKDDFEPTSEAIRAVASDENMTSVTWAQVAAELAEACGRIEVKQINGSATDALDYIAHRDGVNVIAVGGDKLSRGLTLEGLSVSYFLRASQMYDTLMQMGRWFGYRPGYLDLCRLFTTDDLRLWYRHIALAEVELRREFDRMKDAGLTPRRYGLRVRQHPDGLLITAMNKMSHAQTQKLSYAGQLVQTPCFLTSPDIVQGNASVVEYFISQLTVTSQPKKTDSAWIWTDVAHTMLIEGLLRDFSVAPECWKLQKPELMEFIRRQAAAGELTHWTVALIDTQGGANWNPAGLEVGMAERSPEKGTWDPTHQVPSLFATGNSNIQSPRHQAIDLAEMTLNDGLLAQLLAKRTESEGSPLFDEQELRRCWKGSSNLLDVAHRMSNRTPAAGSKPESINGVIARNLRPESHGLILIYPIVPKERDWHHRLPFMGLVFSFPSSHTASAVDYKVNKVWQETFQDKDYVDVD